MYVSRFVWGCLESCMKHHQQVLFIFKVFVTNYSLQHTCEARPCFHCPESKRKSLEGRKSPSSVTLDRISARGASVIRVHALLLNSSPRVVSPSIQTVWREQDETHRTYISRRTFLLGSAPGGSSCSTHPVRSPDALWRALPGCCKRQQKSTSNLLTAQEENISIPNAPVNRFSLVRTG